MVEKGGSESVLPVQTCGRFTVAHVEVAAIARPGVGAIVISGKVSVAQLL